jgi:hypothetical protein
MSPHPGGRAARPACGHTSVGDRTLTGIDAHRHMSARLRPAENALFPTARHAGIHGGNLPMTHGRNLPDIARNTTPDTIIAAAVTCGRNE